MSECASRNAATSRLRFLARLFRDRRGNTLAIVGAAMVPLAAMIGSGVDMSRAYMAKTRLQSACDAAALAGRRVMLNDSLGTNVEPEARRFFHFNFPKTTTNGVTTGPYQTAEIVNPTVTRPAPGTVRVTASTTIPTSVMRMFGFTTLPLSVTCDAALNFVNTDVMLVLDTTGSMDDDINGNSTTTDSLRKITALRAAVMALYTELQPTQAQLEANGLRLRYGIVPYSSSVNVGHQITAVNAAYIRDSSPYQTRTANYNNYGTTTVSDNTITETYASSISQTECNNYAANAGYPTLNGQPANTGGPAPAPVTAITYSLRDWGATGDTSGTTRTCRRYKRTLVTQTGYRSSGWTYREALIDTSQYKLGTAVTLGNSGNGVMASQDTQATMREIAANAVGATTTSVTWNGCIEERDSVSTIVESTDLTIPAAAYDLNINFIPNSDATRWRPHWPDVLYRRDVNQSTTTNSSDVEYMGDHTDDSVACPAEARRLQAWTQANLQTYVNGLTPRGYTYHDIGMIWGARMLSNAGIFSADNPDTFNSMPVTRHIIFMTDGALLPQCSVYSSWGLERNDRRVTGSYTCTDQYDRHMQRFQMTCNAARGMGFSVWVIAFGTTLTPEMAACASNPNQAAASSSSADLIARFRQIGSNIGALRLTQ
ncbi:MAG TPA: TadE/TadG family type IV pilus assembly protein [Allosphingosinicella sp.]|nr:TadE/TadG family type IV pilus assembly protein [Allosphingosinicella sp.]